MKRKFTKATKIPQILCPWLHANFFHWSLLYFPRKTFQSKLESRPIPNLNLSQKIRKKVNKPDKNLELFIKLVALILS